MYENRSKSSQRKQREEAQVELRQLRRDDLLSKKRTTKTDFTPNIPRFKEYKTAILSNSLEDIYRGTYEVRRLLSVEYHPPINDIIDSGILPRIAEFLSLSCPVYVNGNTEMINDIRIESAWIITNIASGNSKQTEAVVSLGVIKLLVDILAEGIENIDLTDQCVWALGNIGGDSESCRDMIIGQNGGYKIAELICKLCDPSNKNVKENKHLKVIRTCTWLLSNLCRGRQPPPDRDHLHFCKNFFTQLSQMNDEEIVNDSLWALSYIADCDYLLADEILKSNVLERIYFLLFNFVCRYNGNGCDEGMAETCKICISPILRLVGNIVTGTDEQTSVLLNFMPQGTSILCILKDLFYNYNDSRKMTRIRKEICWVFSNIAAGTHEQVQKLIDTQIQTLLIDAIKYSELPIRTEACWGLSNLVSYVDKDKDQFDLLVNIEMIHAICSYLEMAVVLPEMQGVSLTAFDKMLSAGDIWSKESGQDNIVVSMFNEQIIKVIEDLQDSEEFVVNEKAYNIIMKYFGGVEEKEN